DQAMEYPGLFRGGIYSRAHHDHEPVLAPHRAAGATACQSGPCYGPLTAPTAPGCSCSAGHPPTAGLRAAGVGDPGRLLLGHALPAQSPVGVMPGGADVAVLAPTRRDHSCTSAQRPTRTTGPSQDAGSPTFHALRGCSRGRSGITDGQSAWSTRLGQV